MPGMTTTTTTSTALNNYFVPGYGISRAVIQSEIRYHCGPDAIVRPFTHQVRDHINYCSTCCMMLHPPAQLTLPACPGPRWIPRHHQRSFIDKSIRPSKPVPTSPNPSLPGPDRRHQNRIQRVRGTPCPTDQRGRGGAVCQQAHPRQSARPQAGHGGKIKKRRCWSWVIARSLSTAGTPFLVGRQSIAPVWSPFCFEPHFSLCVMMISLHMYSVHP